MIVFKKVTSSVLGGSCAKESVGCGGLLIEYFFENFVLRFASMEKSAIFALAIPERRSAMKYWCGSSAG